MVSGKHSIFTHFPKDRNCEVCKKTKIIWAPYRKRTGNQVPRAEKFGDLITADLKFLSEDCEARNNQLQKPKTQLLRKQRRVYKSSSRRQLGRKSFLLTLLCILAKPVKKYPGIIVHLRLTVPKQNGIAGRAVRRIKEGTSAVLLRCGLDEKGVVCMLLFSEKRQRHLIGRENTL